VTPPLGRSARFVRETTVSPKFACWVLYDGDRVVGSVLTGAGVNQTDAMTLLVEKTRSDAAVLAYLDRLIAEAE
jgi:hypothetical protein